MRRYKPEKSKLAVLQLLFSFPMVAFAVFVALVNGFVLMGASVAYADEPVDYPSMLIVDAGLGDCDLAALHWLGEDVEIAAQESDFSLLTSKLPEWWIARGESSQAPRTFLLARNSDGPTTSENIIWALDAIRQTGAEPRTFVLAIGGTGFALREYAEDLASQKQSDRADLVGLGFCGMPHNGYCAIEIYPEQGLWETLANSAGMSVEDLGPGSGRLASLNQGAFPVATKNINIVGAVGDLGFGPTDGAGVEADFTFDESVSDQVVSSQVAASLSQQINLTSIWAPFASSIDYPGRSVDGQLASRLSAFPGYETSEEVQDNVFEFYQAWFSASCPATHYSNVLLLDLSGSMNEGAESDRDKLSAAKESVRQYLKAMQACSALPHSAPMDLSIFGFNERVDKVADGFAQSAIDAVELIDAQGETNIGIALERALDSLDNAPECASKRILLLSDGESTLGKDDEELLSGPVGIAVERGIVIDTIGFGDVGESDAGFLRQVSSLTGGEYFGADDTYNLKVSFLKSYYSSLGIECVEEETASGSTCQIVGSVDSKVSALEASVVGDDSAPEARFIVNGSPLDESLYSITHEGTLTTLDCLNPPAGDYAIELSGDAGAAHVFVVKQRGMVDSAYAVGEQADYSLYMLIGVGVLLIGAVLFVILLARRKSRVSGLSDADRSQLVLPVRSRSVTSHAKEGETQ